MPLRGFCTSTTDGSTGTGTTAVLTFPAGAQVGDVFYGMSTLNSSTGTATAAAGTGNSWDSPTIPQNNQSNVLLSSVWIRTLTAADVATGSVTITQSSGRINAGGAVMYGVTAPSSPSTQVGYAGAGPANSTVVMPTVTTTAANAEVGVIVASRVASGTAAVATYPSGWTKDNTSTTNNASGVNFSNSTGHLTTPGPAGTYGGGTITTSPPSTAIICYVIPFQAASTSTTLTVHGARAATRAQKPLLAQASALIAHGARAATRAGHPALTQATPLAVRGARATSRAGRPLLAQASTLLGHGARSLTRAGHPLIDQATGIIAHGARSATRAEQPGLTQVTDLTVRDVRAATRAASPALAQVSALVAHGARAATRAAAATLTGPGVVQLVIHGARAVTRAGSARLAQQSTLATHDARAETRAESPVVAQVTLLEVRGARAETRAAAPLLAQLVELAVNGARALTRAATARLFAAAAPTPPERITIVLGEDRTTRIPAEDRVTRIPAESRTTTVTRG